jgi:GAG-pre-integrase domain
MEDLLLLHHRRLHHPSFSALSRLYSPLFEKANKEKLVCDACEFGKHIRSSYSSSGRSSLVFDLVHSDIWGPCPTTAVNGYKYFVSFITVLTVYVDDMSPKEHRMVCIGLPIHDAYHSFPKPVKPGSRGLFQPVE